MNDPDRLARLNERQKACLRLYYQGLEAKEIARELGISPNTVNQHFRDARRILGVARSVQAARLLAEAEGHNRIGTDPRRIAAAERADQMGGAALPETSGRIARKNRYGLGLLTRLGIIIALAFGAAAATGALIEVSDVITRFIEARHIDLSDPPNDDELATPVRVGRVRRSTMLIQRKQAFETIQPLFRAAEVKTDQAAADAATLIAEMLRVRQDARLPISAGQDMLEKLVAALGANVAARKLFIEAHAMTPALVKELGLERMFGDGSPCPKTAFAVDQAGVVPIVRAA